MNEIPDIDGAEGTDLVAEALSVEALPETNNPGFTTAYCAATAGSASCPVGSASSAGTFSSQSG